MSVSVNPPKTPVTKGSNGIAAATVPNVCKMPGPPAPFIPVPLPNIGKSGDSPKGYSKKVKIEGDSVAIKGATFKSMGDIASKGTGGGLISANTHGITKFVGPGSMDVKIEGKNVQFLSDPMLNNCAGGGSPPNAATLLGILQAPGVIAVLGDVCELCDEAPHEPLAESTATQADASALVSSYGAEIAKPGVSKKHKKPTMLGVVHCKCAKKYADKSSKTNQALHNAAASNGMVSPPGQGTNVLARIQSHAGNDEIYTSKLALAQSRHKKFGDDTTGTEPAAYPPGACAAQGALVLCLDSGGLPTAMSEKFFSPEPGGKTAASILYYDDTIGPTRELVARQFAHGDTVPPCLTCDLLVPLLLCFEADQDCTD